ncbi:MAG: hypothetical protein QOK10_3389, partial [Pseudonocardiales bacterium]|nr:hypothetical protein [Pseudonocardiales bacterium]
MGVSISARADEHSGRRADQVAPAAKTARQSATHVLQSYAGLPLAFVANRGQTDRRARYYALGSRYAFYVTRKGVVLSLVKRSTTLRTRGVALAWRFGGASPRARIVAQRRLTGRVNSLHGNDPARWRTDLARHAVIRYRGLWHGVDLSLSGHAGTLKYEFRLKPGARIRDIRLSYRGATGLALDRGGALLVRTAVGNLRDSAPVAYQTVAGKRV